MQKFASFANISLKIVEFVKMCAKRANVFDFYAKSFTKLEKRGVIVIGLKETGVIGCRPGVEKGSNDRHLIIHQHMGVPPGPRHYDLMEEAPLTKQKCSRTIYLGERHWIRTKIL